MAKNEPLQTHDQQRLVLRSTKLMCVDGVVAKSDKTALITAQYPLRSIVDIRVESVAEFTYPATAIAFFAAFGWASWNYIPNSTVSQLITWICVGICIFLLFGIRANYIVIETRSGTVRYTALEPIEELRGFALAVKLRTTADTPVGRWRAELDTSTVLIEFEEGPIEGPYKQIVQSGDSVVREYGHWYRDGYFVHLIVMATDIPQHPRFGVDSLYEVTFLDVDHLRIHGPGRENWKLARSSMELTGFEELGEQHAASETPLVVEDRPLTSRPASPDSATPPQS
jgi:hypothetical protein